MKKASCLGKDQAQEGHSRRSCRECRAEYARRWRKTISGRVYSKWYEVSLEGSHLHEAKKKVYIAVRSGALPKAKTQTCPCGSKAQVYHHEDYLKPLDVIAVCRVCNRRRGRGENSPFPLEKNN